jgi:hypothetical protein
VLLLTAGAKVKIKMKLMKKDSKKVEISEWQTVNRKPHTSSGKVKISSVNKNILIIDDVLIKSIFLLPNYKYMNNQIKKFLKCIKHLSFGSVLSCCEYIGLI